MWPLLQGCSSRWPCSRSISLEMLCGTYSIHVSEGEARTSRIAKAFFAPPPGERCHILMYTAGQHSAALRTMGATYSSAGGLKQPDTGLTIDDDFKQGRLLLRLGLLIGGDKGGCRRWTHVCQVKVLGHPSK